MHCCKICSQFNHISKDKKCWKNIPLFAFFSIITAKKVMLFLNHLHFYQLHWKKLFSFKRREIQLETFLWLQLDNFVWKLFRLWKRFRASEISHNFNLILIESEKKNCFFFSVLHKLWFFGGVSKQSLQLLLPPFLPSKINKYFH